jgi:hypothetical protein
MQTLPVNLANNPHAKFVLLNYNSGDGLNEYVFKNHQDALKSGKLVLYSHLEPDKFHMAHAKNMAHRLGIREGADVLVNLDADNFTGPGFDRWLQDQFFWQYPWQGAERFLWSNMIKGQLDRGITGRIAVTRNAFLMVGGYDEKFAEWSPDDEDFKCRLRLLNIPSGEIPPQFLKAVRHTDKLRFREYRHVERKCYDQPKPPVCPSVAVVNGGNVGCGKVFRNESTKPIWIAPIPTRVFGIGMHKTGTSSLDSAFKMLGFNSAHWNTALWARGICEEMARGRSATVEQHYTFSDLPFTLLYKELDKAYPGSKFILTVRPEHDWIRSVRNHWDPKINPWRKDWDIAPFTHVLHQRLYGRKTFDADAFLARYRQHNAEVIAYFKNRPGDLLVMKVDKPEWGALCAFLDRPIPDVPFPHALRTAAHQATALMYEI